MKKSHLGIILLLSLAVRVPLLVFQHDAYLTGGITTSLGLVARNLLEGRGLSETTGPFSILQLYDRQVGEKRLIDIQDFPDPPDQSTKPLIQRMPGYPFLLAALWKVTGEYRYLPVQILQVGLSALLPLLLAGTARRLFGSAAGLAAGVLAALNVPEARLSLVPLYDWWLVPIAALYAWILVRSAPRGYPARDFLLLGMVGAAGVYLKPTVAALPLFVVAALLPRLSRRQLVLRGALAFGIPLLALLPWAARNHRVFHRPILTTTFFWATIWEGYGEIPNRFGAVLDDRRTYMQVLSRDKLLEYGTPEYDDYFRAKVLSVMASNPGFVAGLWAQRLIRGLLFPDNSWGIPWAEDLEASYIYFQSTHGGGPLAYLRARPGVAVVKVARKIWEPLLLVLALLTLGADRARFKEFLPLVAIPLAGLAATIPLHLESRYLLPATQIWILFAAAPVAAWLVPGSPGSGGRAEAPEAPP
ncbi:MAG TPA: glycosyltransferase family 39 protein [Candidatus Polarisedimenticolia bacterium]|jgi:4-amino-4-deoxy-L-arabinose transferase-like glycosyltransferase|nr:glycosyltransferase family 39 protein [Candidatus Polarisedimenticolia bacterium]